MNRKVTPPTPQPKQFLISKDVESARAKEDLLKAAEWLLKNEPTHLLGAAHNEHMVKRLALFATLCDQMLEHRCTTMQLCVLYWGDSFYRPTYLEVQLVDRKNVIAYATVTLDHT